jgi:hypothetical protein
MTFKDVAPTIKHIRAATPSILKLRWERIWEAANPHDNDRPHYRHQSD